MTEPLIQDRPAAACCGAIVKFDGASPAYRRILLVASGCFVEIIAFTPRVFVPVDRPTVLEAVLRRHPVQTVLDGQAA